MSILNINRSASVGFTRFMPSANAWLFNGQEIQLGEVVMDHESVKTGWGLMREGSASDWAWDSQLGIPGSQPTSEHKRGFSVCLHNASIGRAEWSSTGTGPVIGFDKIFEEIWNQKDAHPGMVPLVEYVGSKPLKIGKGNTREPAFRIIKWVLRSSVQLDPQGPSDPKSSEAAAAATPASSALDDLPFD